jgi:hypothetical protein
MDNPTKEALLILESLLFFKPLYLLIATFIDRKKVHLICKGQHYIWGDCCNF